MYHFAVFFLFETKFFGPIVSHSNHCHIRINLIILYPIYRPYSMVYGLIIIIYYLIAHYLLFITCMYCAVYFIVLYILLCCIMFCVIIAAIDRLFRYFWIISNLLYCINWLQKIFVMYCVVSGQLALPNSISLFGFACAFIAGIYDDITMISQLLAASSFTFY